MKKINLLFLFFLCFIGYSQQTSFNINKTLFVKGFGYINFLDGGYGSIIGLEKGFLKHQSIGLKFINNINLPRQESVTDKYGVKHDLGDYESNPDKSYIVEYKYYMFSSQNPFGGLYLSINTKWGTSKIRKDSNYEHDYYNQKTDYFFYGPAIGLLVPVSSSNKWLMDIQLSYLDGYKKVYTEYVQPIVYNDFNKFKTNKFRFEITIVYKISY